MSTSTTGSTPKSMSSRLLTMKFMQRAAASSPTTTSPSTPDEPSPKRRKKDSDSPADPSFDVNALANQSTIQAAIASEDTKREAALERAAADAGDMRWVLSFEDRNALTPSRNLALRVVQTGYANLDASGFRPTEEDKEEDTPMMVGRRSFGEFNKVLEKKQNDEDGSDSSSEDDDEDESEAESEDDEDPASQLIRASRKQATERARAERKAKKRAEKAESEKLARKRKKNEVKLNGLTSLSGRAAPSFSVACFTCGGPHHKKDCPRQNKRGYRGGDDGPSRKAIKTR